MFKCNEGPRNVLYFLYDTLYQNVSDWLHERYCRVERNNNGG